MLLCRLTNAIKQDRLEANENSTGGKFEQRNAGDGYSMPLMTINEASEWASKHLTREVSPTNISYLLQYGRIRKHVKNDSALVDLHDLEEYYQSRVGAREDDWKRKLGDDLNWTLSFDHLREMDTTKHVHRLHPYKGKFIPQLVEYFLGTHTDDFKTETYFRTGDIVLDPFSGSGTTLVQAAEMGIHSIGIDISRFNCMISEVKLRDYNFDILQQGIKRIQEGLANYGCDNNIAAFEKDIAQQLTDFNKRWFPSPDFKYRLRRGEIREEGYVEEKEQEFLQTYNQLAAQHEIPHQQSTEYGFLGKWYCESIRKEIDFCFSLICDIEDKRVKEVLSLILSRTIRSCRATRHYDLATLKDPQFTVYYCWKHKKICKPLYSMKSWFQRYSKDTLERLRTFSTLRQPTHFAVLPADSREVDILEEVRKRDKEFHALLRDRSINGIFTSPPYVGQIDYHEQHAYAYELFGFERKDKLEIGPLCKGQGADARHNYVMGVARVLQNSSKYLVDDYDVFLVANDKYNLYPRIADRAGMRIVNQFKRPVLNRTERDRTPYSESIFHLKKRE